MDWAAPAWPAQTATPEETESAPSWLPSGIADFVDAMPVWLGDMLQAVVVVLLAYGVSKLLVRVFGRRIARRLERPSLTRTALRGIRVTVFVFAMLTVMGIYGYRLSDFALSVTVFTAIIGVILAPIFGSIVSGVFLLADQPYEIGDMIELTDSGRRGFIEDITLRYTKLFTLDNTFLVIPNGTMRERDVANYSAEDSRTRQSLDVLVTYESDLARARKLMEDAARDVDGVVTGGPDIRVGAARYPAGPTCYVDEFGDHGVNLRLRYWVNEPYWLLRSRSHIQTTLRDAIQDEDVEIAYPHQHHVFDETSGEMRVAVADDPGSRPEGRRAGGADSDCAAGALDSSTAEPGRQQDRDRPDVHGDRAGGVDGGRPDGGGDGRTDVDDEERPSDSEE